MNAGAAYVAAVLHARLVNDRGSHQAIQESGVEAADSRERQSGSQVLPSGSLNVALRDVAAPLRIPAADSGLSRSESVEDFAHLDTATDEVGARRVDVGHHPIESACRPGLTRGVFLSLYVVLDLYSRYVVAWMVAGRENSALAKQLLAEVITRHGIEPGRLRVHQDRGAPMTAHGFLDLLAELGVDPSHSRPRVSNDNALSEAQFKALKYQPDFPGRFRDVEHARAWCAEFFD